MRIAFVPQAGALGFGGITRCLAVAEAAVLRGHRVAFLVPLDYPLLDRFDLGARFTVPRPVQRAVGAGESASFAESLAIRGMLEGDYLTEAIRVESNALDAFGADAVFTENQPTIAISCHRLSVPFVATAATINLRSFAEPVDRTLESELSRVAWSVGIDATTCEELLHECAALNIAPTTAELEPALSSLPRLKYVGPLLFAPIELRSFGMPDDWRPVALVYLSRGLVTIENLMPAIAEGFDSHWRIAVASRPGENVPPLPANVEVLSMPGITRALQSTDLVVTRGGQNTLMACMLAGCPVVGTPGWSAEPTFNLAGLSRLGAAAFVPGVPVGSTLRTAVDQVLTGDAASRAREVGDLLRKHDGAVGVVRLMEDFVG